MKLIYTIIAALILMPSGLFVQDIRTRQALICLQNDGEPDMGLFVTCTPPRWCPSNSDKCSAN